MFFFFDKGGLIVFITTILNPEFAFATSSPVIDQPLLHKWLVDIGQECLERLLKHGMVDGICINSDATIPSICDPCIAAKQHRSPFQKRCNNRTLNLLNHIISDIHGPLPVHTLSGYRYWITFTDDCMRYRHVYLLKTKDEAFEAYWAYEALVENQTSSRVKRFRNNKGREYIGHKWNQNFQHWGSPWTYYERHAPTKWHLRTDKPDPHWRNSCTAAASLPPSINVGRSSEATSVNHQCYSNFCTHRQNTIQGLVQPQTKPQHATHIWMHCPCPCAKGWKKGFTAQIM